MVRGERENSDGAEEESGEVICVSCGFVYLYFSEGGKVKRRVGVMRKRRNGQCGAILQTSARGLTPLLPPPPPRPPRFERIPNNLRKRKEGEREDRKLHSKLHRMDSTKSI